MQWTPDRNAGFSAATPGRLHLPLIQDPVTGYQSVNVEAQLENTSSLLHWTRRMIHARRNHPAFGLGTFTDLGGSNPSVLSYVREHTDADGREDVIVCVNNLSRFPQPVAARPAPLGGPGAGGAARRRAVPAGRRAALPADARRLRLLLVPADPAGQRGGRARDPRPRDATSSTARWFGGKGRPFTVTGGRRLGVLGPARPTAEQPTLVVELVSLAYGDAEGGTEHYQVPLSCYPGRRSPPRARPRRHRPTTPTSGRSTPTTRSTTGRRWRYLLEAFSRPAGRGRAALRAAARPRPRPRPPTPRCSAASSPTPRWPSARTRCSRCSARSPPAATPTSPSTTC